MNIRLDQSPALRQLFMNNDRTRRQDAQEDKLAEMLVMLILSAMLSSMENRNNNGSSDRTRDDVSGKTPTSGSKPASGTQNSDFSTDSTDGSQQRGTIGEFADLLKLLIELLDRLNPPKTNSLADKLAELLGLDTKPSTGDSTGDSTGGTSPGGTSPGGTSPGGTSPGGTSPTGTKLDGTSPGGTVPTDSKPGDTKPGETKPGETKPAETKPDTEKPPTDTQGAAKASKVGQVPPGTEVVIVNETIKIKPGEVFDGKGKHYVAGPGLGDGGQGEGQKPVFDMGNNSTLKNAYVSGADGVHTQGNAKLENVSWPDVGEDGITMKGEGDVSIDGGWAANAADKFAQLNAGGRFSMNNFHLENFGKGIRTNGGKDFPIDINVTNSTFVNGKEAVVRTDAEQARIRMSGNQVEGTPNDVLAPAAASVEGATSLGSKKYSG